MREFRTNGPEVWRGCVAQNRPQKTRSWTSRQQPMLKLGPTASNSAGCTNTRPNPSSGRPFPAKFPGTLLARSCVLGRRTRGRSRAFSNIVDVQGPYATQHSSTSGSVSL